MRKNFTLSIKYKIVKKALQKLEAKLTILENDVNNIQPLKEQQWLLEKIKELHPTKKPSAQATTSE